MVCLWLAEFGPAAALAAVEDEEKAYRQGWLAIHAAARRGYALVVRMLLAAAPQTAGHSTPHGRTPLHEAATSGDADTVELLLAVAPATAAAADSAGRFPLHEAAAALSAKAVLLLYAAHPEAALAADAEGWMPLHCAAAESVIEEEEEEEEALDALLQAAPEAAFHAHAGGRQPLHLAAGSYSSERALRSLLNAAPNAARAADKDGVTALHRAAITGHTAAVQILAEAAPDMLLAQDADGETPLHWAAGSLDADAEVVEACLAAAPLGTSLVTAKAKNGCLPLHFAAEANNLSALDAICRALPPGGVTATNLRGWAGERSPGKMGHVQMAAALVAAAPGSLTLTVDNGSTPMHLAAYCCRSEHKCSTS
mgnify:CR=1 FL=1